MTPPRAGTTFCTCGHLDLRHRRQKPRPCEECDCAAFSRRHGRPLLASSLQSKFLELQLKWRRAHAAEQVFHRRMRYKYRHLANPDAWHVYCTNAERTHWELLDGREQEAAIAFFDWLENYTPRGRRWRQGLSMYWLLENLSFEMAMARHEPEGAPKI